MEKLWIFFLALKLAIQDSNWIQLHVPKIVNSEWALKHTVSTFKLSSLYNFLKDFCFPQFSLASFVSGRENFLSLSIPRDRKYLIKTYLEGLHNFTQLVSLMWYYSLFLAFIQSTEGSLYCVIHVPKPVIRSFRLIFRPPFVKKRRVSFFHTVCFNVNSEYAILWTRNWIQFETYIANFKA